MLRYMEEVRSFFSAGPDPSLTQVQLDGQAHGLCTKIAIFLRKINGIPDQIRLRSTRHIQEKKK